MTVVWRSGWAVLAAGALVASLLAVAASPAGAQDDRLADTPDETTKLSACVGDALGDQMFTDVSDDHAFQDAINCVAYYGITNGTGDGATYSPNDNVTRAEMAVFIARAAEKAGVELKSGSGGFSDIGGVWQEAQDAINGLAASGMIADGGAFRPDDDINRAEMASFLVGLLAAAASNVTIDSDGVIQLGSSGSAQAADDWFADARASVPAANDAEISALYELGVTKGASAAAKQDTTKRPLDYNYEPFGTVNRGEMAEFITRALAHTSVRPEGISAQYDGSDLVISARDENFQPVSNVTVDVFRIDTGGIDLAFRGDGSCGEVGKVSAAGMHLCEIDGADPITGGDGDANLPLGGIDTDGTTVWAWTGDTGDTVGDDTDTYKLEIPEGADTKVATQVRISTENVGKAHLGSSVLYTVQLEDNRGAVTVGTDAKKPRPAQFLVSLSTHLYLPQVPDTNNPGEFITNPLADNSGDFIGFLTAANVVTPVPLTTDADGKATFSVSGLPDQAPSVKSDKYRVAITILPRTNAPSAGAAGAETYHIGAAPGTPAAGIQAAGGAVSVGNVIFSTEASTRDTTRVSVSVKPGASYVASVGRGASNRATVSVTDQYGDPIPGSRVSLTSTGAPNTNAPTAVTIGGGRFLAVGRDGSYTFGYTRANNASATETLTPRWDHDGDDCTTAQVADNTHRCNDLDGDGPESTAGTEGIAGTPMTVEWAAAASAEQTTGIQIRAFDTETNTIFVSASPGNSDALVVYYDSNDRFDIDGEGSTYAEFERKLSKAADNTLAWEAIGSGSRTINSFMLINP